MTDEQICQWKVERDIARGIKDSEERRIALEKVYDHRDEMQMTCIAHQSMRQKKLVNDVEELKEKIAPLQKDHEEYQQKKAEAKGAIKLLRILKWTAIAFGGAGVMKLVQALPL